MDWTIFTREINIHKDWQDFLNQENMHILSAIAENISSLIRENKINPPVKRILFFLERPLLSAKIIILGQDPYPQPGAATGRAFEVGNLQSWQNPFRNLSLQNIIRAIVNGYFNKILTFKQIRKSILSGSLELKPPAELFKFWEEQGVLLLNTALSCEINKAGSHAELWYEFSKNLFHYIHHTNPELNWFIWGNNAMNSIDGLNIKNIFFSYHPSRCQPRAKDFLYGEVNCFAETKHLINWL